MAVQETYWLGDFDTMSASRLANKIDECVAQGKNGAFTLNEAKFVVTPNHYGGNVRVLSESGMDTTTINGETATKMMLNEFAPLALAAAPLLMNPAVRAAGKAALGKAGSLLKQGIQNGPLGQIFKAGKNAFQNAKQAQAVQQADALSQQLVQTLNQIGTPQAKQAATGVQQTMQKMAAGAEAPANDTQTPPAGNSANTNTDNTTANTTATADTSNTQAATGNAQQNPMGESANFVADALNEDGWSMDLKNVPVVGNAEEGKKLYKVGMWSGKGYGLDIVMVYADNEEDAIEKGVSYAETNFPEVIADDEVENLKGYLRSKGKDDETIEATIDNNYVYVEPHYIRTENLQVIEAPEGFEQRLKDARQMQELHEWVAVAMKRYGI